MIINLGIVINLRKNLQILNFSRVTSVLFVLFSTGQGLHVILPRFVHTHVYIHSTWVPPGTIRSTSGNGNFIINIFNKYNKKIEVGQKYLLAFCYKFSSVLQPVGESDQVERNAIIRFFSHTEVPVLDLGRKKQVIRFFVSSRQGPSIYGHEL